MSDRRVRRRKTRERPHIQRGLSIIPSLFTIGNIFCGYYSVISSLRGNFDHAALAIGFGAVLDGLDGRIARLTNTTSDFGLELDSIADFATFGVAPGMLAFSWGLGALRGMQADVIDHVTQFGWFATFAFVLCGALRLARFNIQSKKPPETATKRYFVGLPIPAAAGVVAAIVHYLKSPILMVGSALLWYLLITIVAVLMISTVRYYSFKEFDLKKRRPQITGLATALLIWSILTYSEYVLLTLAVAYVSSGPILKLVQIVRRLLPSHVASSETAHGNIGT
jgi:CDP-diacylglycerol--serine O-phosphatidyltransferase